MSQSVSFILPIRDMQGDLGRRVQTILDVLSDLSEAFDLLIVDYGSKDDSIEIAYDLMRHYPQVELLECGSTSDLYEAVVAGIARTRGEIIFVHDTRLPLAVSAIEGLWPLRNDDDLVMAQSRSLELESTPQLSRDGLPVSLRSARPEPSAGSIQMIRRCAMPEARQRKRARGYAVDRVTRMDLNSDASDAPRLPKLLARLRKSVR